MTLRASVSHPTVPLLPLSATWITWQPVPSPSRKKTIQEPPVTPPYLRAPAVTRQMEAFVLTVKSVLVPSSAGGALL